MSIRLIFVCMAMLAGLPSQDHLRGEEPVVRSLSTSDRIAQTDSPSAESNGVVVRQESAKLTSKGISSGSKFFDPVKQSIEGWTVHVDPKMLSGKEAKAGAKALKMLENHLFFISLLAPERRLAELRRLEIWIEHRHPSLTNMQYHPSAGWLTKNGHDPRLEKKVHIPVAAQLLDRGQLMKHPMVVLHELSHAYHDQILGFNDPRVIKVFQKAKASLKYQRVLADNGRQVRHYALSNHKEYFAESTEAYFNRNDFYPFVQAELKEHDPDMFALMKEIWGDLRIGK